jgi:hypothetical protein
MSKEKDISESEKYTISHLGIIRLFAIWSLLDLFVYYVTNNNRQLELLVMALIFVGINIIIYIYPWLVKYI